MALVDNRDSGRGEDLSEMAGRRRRREARPELTATNDAAESEVAMALIRYSGRGLLAVVLVGVLARRMVVFENEQAGGPAHDRNEDLEPQRQRSDKSKRSTSPFHHRHVRARHRSCLGPILL
jgi:hypothetical protein